MSASLFPQTPTIYGRKTSRFPLMETGTDPMAYEWLRLGVRAAIEGNREDARYYFVQAVRTDLNFARGWLYLGGVADDPALTLSCVQKVLQLQADEGQAWTGLVWSREKLGLLQPPLPILPAVPAPPSNLAIGMRLPVEVSALTPLAIAPPPITAHGVTAPTASESRAVLAWPSLAPAPPLPAPAPPPAAPATPEAPPADADSTEPLGGARLLKRGVKAAAEGDRARARYYFLRAIAADPDNPRAWLYYGGVADDPYTTLACMERVLRAEPNNMQAHAGAEWAVRKLGIQTAAMRWWK